MGSQRGQPLQLRLAGNPALENCLALGKNPMALAFGGHIVAMQEQALVQVLAFYQALYSGRVVAVNRLDVAVLHHQRVFQGHQEA
jgi:hypothetical protein